MYRFFRESGIISVFLVIILVPCIAVSSMFVDISRVMLGKGAATSAADLALNSLMSNYDALLTELYGLVGSCQTIDQFYSESTELFVEALQSRELSTEDIDSLLGYTMSVFNNDEIKDLLALEVTGDTSKIITPVKDANLGNAVIIEDQIVEFMKYRGPIEITKGIIDRLQKGNVAEALGGVNENEDLIEDKEEFADAADDLSRQLYYLDKKIKAYEKKTPDRNKIKTMCSDMEKYRELYREINFNLVAYLHNTSGLSEFSRYTITLNNYKNTYKKGTNYFEDVNNGMYSIKVDNEDGTVIYYIEQEDMQARINDLKTKKQDFINAKNAVINAVGTDLINANVGTGENQTNPIQWWKAVASKISSSYSTFQTEAKDMLKSYAKLLVVYEECEIAETYKVLWETQDKAACEKILNDVKSDHGNYLVSGRVNNSDNYLKLVNKYESVSRNSSYQNLKNSSALKLSNGKTINTTVSEISTSLKDYRKNLVETMGIIDEIVDGDGWLAKYKGLDNLKTYVKTYNKKLTDWESTAESTDSTMAEEDLQEISIHEDKYGAVTEQSVTQLKNRFLNIKSQMQEIVDAIDGMTYGGEKIRTIDSYTDVYENVKGKIGTVPLSNSEIKTKAETLFKDNFVPYSANKAAVLTLSHINDLNYSPVLTENEPSLYTFIKEEFKNQTVSEEDAESKTDEVDGKEDEADSKDKENNAGKGRTSEVSTDNINDESSADTFPSGFGGATYGFSDSLTGLISVVKNLVTGNATTIRDDIYLTEYCMDMFSYATYVNEGKRSLYQDKNPNANILYSNRNTTYMTAEITGNKDTEGTWLSEAKWDTYNQSLTNRMINETNNHAFGAEVEYILFGGTNEQSVKDAYSNIFAFRYILNFASAMQYYWGGKTSTGQAVNWTATAISSATSGIVPAILIKVIIIGLLTLAETDHDLDILQAGLSVPIYKADEDWCYSFPKGDSFSFKDNKNEDKGLDKFGLYYSDYMYLFLLMGFQGDTKSAMCKRIGDVIQVNMRIASAKKNYSLKKSIVYFNLTASVKVKPLMLDLSYAEDYANNPKNDETLFTIKVNETRGYS